MKNLKKRKDMESGIFGLIGDGSKNNKNTDLYDMRSFSYIDEFEIKLSQVKKLVIKLKKFNADN